MHLVLHIPLSLIGLKIILNILSKIRSIFPSFESCQHSLPYVTLGLIRVLYYICLVWCFKFSEFSCFFNPQLVLLAIIIHSLNSVLESFSSVKIFPGYLTFFILSCSLSQFLTCFGFGLGVCVCVCVFCFGFFFSGLLLLCFYIQGVTEGKDQTSGGCSLCWTIPI